MAPVPNKIEKTPGLKIHFTLQKWLSSYVELEELIESHDFFAIARELKQRPWRSGWRLRPKSSGHRLDLRLSFDAWKK